MLGLPSDCTSSRYLLTQKGREAFTGNTHRKYSAYRTVCLLYYIQRIVSMSVLAIVLIFIAVVLN